ncbi:MAG: hypothetical protein OSA99_20550, partial [Acidimicrobiales bacterium]|nr:hypothetical protein [Acidimicrobiales bacterium]
MHLMLRVETDHDDPFDVVATVEPNHTVDELRNALVRYASSGGSTLVRGRTGHMLAPDATLGEIGLVSGEVVALSDGARSFAAQDID